MEFKELHENNSETKFYAKIYTLYLYIIYIYVYIYTKLTYHKHSYYKPSLNFTILQLKIRISKPERKIFNYSKHNFLKSNEFYFTVA